MYNAIEWFAMVGAAFSLSLTIMFVAWAIYVFQKKANIVDVGWAAAFLASSWAYLLIGDGYIVKRWVITAMVTIWAVRLGRHLLERYLKQPEDPRYADMRARWNGDSNNLQFLMMFLFQGILVVLLSAPFFVVSFAAKSEWTGWELFGFLIWAVGLAGESLADRQLAQFRSESKNVGKILSKGLWYYSRHPNYFFEWVVWLGLFLFAFPSPGGWLALVSPVLMFGLLTQGSGIPLNEAQSLQSKGDAYRDYQSTTQPFFPWFPRKQERNDH